MKNIFIFRGWSRFQINLIWFIAFILASSACCLLKSFFYHLIVFFEINACFDTALVVTCAVLTVIVPLTSIDASV